MKYAVLNADGVPIAFYADDIHGKNVPEEAVPITDEQWHECVTHPGQRKITVSRGKAVVTVREETAEERYERLASAIRLERDARLEVADKKVWQAEDTGSASLSAWREYRQALRDVPQQPGFPENVVWPEEPA